MKTMSLDANDQREIAQSAKPVSDPYVRLAGFMEQTGITPARLEKILASGVLKDMFDATADFADRDAIRKAMHLNPSPTDTNTATKQPDVFKIVVDYSMTLEQMVAVGKYDWKNDDVVSKEFAVEGAGRVECEATLFSFGRNIFSQEAEKEIQAASPAGQWEPAKIEHLLAFGAKYPEAQRKNPIVSLKSISASTVFGKHYVPYLYRRMVGRSLHLDWYDNEWPAFYCFLAVRRAN